MKQTIPGMDCDGSGANDDFTDDVTVDDDTADDNGDDSTTDDSVPDDYWDCIEKYTTKEACIAEGCGWCDNKGGYGVCFDKDTAKNFDDSEWYSCTIPSFSDLDSESSPLDDPSDPICFVETISGNESSCKGKIDADGKPCDWCSFQGFDFCLNVDQAQLAEQFGASCGDRLEEETNAIGEEFEKVSDPNDPTCLVETISGDESSCKQTMDADGKPCDWCSFQGYDFCLNVDQAQIVEQYGASCDDRKEEELDISEVQTNDISDPSDPSCLVVTIGGDESMCKATKDVDGNACEWCSFQGYDFCLNDDQAAIAEQYGASCNEKVVTALSDPSDPTCLAATLNGGESECKATSDADGNACEWCSFMGYDFCLDDDQATIVEQYGASCGDRESKANNISTSMA